MMRSKVFGFLACATLIMTMTGCGAKTEQKANPPQKTATVNVNDEAAWKKEPAYGKPIKYYLGDACTSGPIVADKKGFYKKQGLTATGVKGTSYTEALGTGKADVAVGHIATMLVPSTNKVDLTFVAGAHVGCKSIYVAGNSKYKTVDDLKGQKIAVPNGIGASDYNITACLLDSKGINPLKEAKLIQVENSACVPAMKNGEIAAALLSDSYAYSLVKNGTLRRIRSLLDEDWIQTPCCMVAMNGTFIKNNPITARKIAAAVREAHIWMGKNPEACTKLLIAEHLEKGDYQKNLDYNSSLKFGLEDKMSEVGLERIANAYIRLGIITSMKDVKDVMQKAWTPLNV